MPEPLAIEGWFTSGDTPALIGTRCAQCGTYHFPPERFSCRNPTCLSTELTDVELSRSGTVWSYSINHYPPPPPGPQEVPYTVAAVRLAAEQMVVLGMVSGSDPAVGDEVTLTVEPLPDGALTWKWRRE